MSGLLVNRPGLVFAREHLSPELTGLANDAFPVARGTGARVCDTGHNFAGFFPHATSTIHRRRT